MHGRGDDHVQQKRHLLRYLWENNIKTDVKERECDGGSWTELAQNKAMINAATNNLTRWATIGLQPYNSSSFMELISSSSEIFKFYSDGFARTERCRLRQRRTGQWLQLHCGGKEGGCRTSTCTDRASCLSVFELCYRTPREVTLFLNTQIHEWWETEAASARDVIKKQAARRLGSTPKRVSVACAQLHSGCIKAMAIK
jgi:hypothetical protein